jgi:hypothetical protein
MKLWHEYAIDPDAMTSFDRSMRILSGIGFDKSRLVSRFPQKWSRRVIAKANDFSIMEKHTIVERLTQLKSCMVERNCEFDGNEPFSLNASRHQESHEFRSILSEFDPGGIQNLLLTNGDFESDDLWSDVGYAKAPRCAESLLNFSKPILQKATKITIIDPYWYPTSEKWLRPVIGLCKYICANCETVEEIEINCCEKDSRADEASFRPFEDNTRAHLTNSLTPGILLNVNRWRELEGGKEFHDRYIFSDLGGFEVRPGIDEGRAGGRYRVTTISSREIGELTEDLDPSKGIYELWQNVRVT